MIKARHRTLFPSAKEAELLKSTQQEAAHCWNGIVAIAKEDYDRNHVWIGKNDLQKALKGRYALHSQTVPALTDKYCDNRKTTATNRRNGNKKMKYPWRVKNFLTVPFNQAAIRSGRTGSLILTLAAGVSFDTCFIPP